MPESKIIWRSNPLALNVQCKTFQFCKTRKIFSKFIFLLLTFFTQEACLVWYSSRMTDETKGKKPKYDFLCKTKINANSYCKKDVKPSVTYDNRKFWKIPRIFWSCFRHCSKVAIYGHCWSFNKACCKLSWSAFLDTSNWRNTLFSKNIYWDICYICTGDLQRPFRNLKINRSPSSPQIRHTGLNYQTD